MADITSRNASSPLNCLEAIDIILAKVRYNKKLVKKCVNYITNCLDRNEINVNKEDKKKENQEFKNLQLQLSLVPFITFANKYVYELIEFQILAKCKLVIVQEQHSKLHNKNECKKKKKKNQLLFDGRFLQEMTTPEIKHIERLQCLLLDSYGHLIKITGNIRSMPKLSKHNYKGLDKPQFLWQLLELGSGSNNNEDNNIDDDNYVEDENFKNPVDYTSIVKFLKRHLLCETTSIDFFIRLHPRSCRLLWQCATKPHQFFLHAITMPNYKLAFLKQVNIQKSKKLKHVRINMHNLRNPPPPLLPPNPFENNRSAAVTVNLSGLNQALRLGVITTTEFHDLSSRLALFVGALWIDYDEFGHTRYLSFIDCKEKKPKFFEVYCNEDDLKKDGENGQIEYAIMQE